MASYKHYTLVVKLDIGLSPKKHDDEQKISFVGYANCSVTVQWLSFKNDRFYYSDDENEALTFVDFLKIFFNCHRFTHGTRLQINISLPADHPVRQLISQHESYVYDAKLEQFVGEC